MNKKRFLNGRAINILASLGMVLGLSAPAALPAFTSAAALSHRSIALSNSATSATGVSYNFSFTTTAVIASGGGVVVDFCTTSTGACVAPTGFTALGATLGTTSLIGTPAVGTATATTVPVTGTAAAGAQTLAIGGITNPSTTDVFYARVYTYASNVALHTSAAAPGAYSDNGTLAIQATDAIGVSASVKESMTFCVSAGAVADLTGSCDNATPPSVTLGDPDGITGLSQSISDTGNTATDSALISTNALHGAVVFLKNTNGSGSGGTACAGLYSSVADGCIDGASGTIEDGSGLFGVNLANVNAALVGNASYTGASSYGMPNTGTATTSVGAGAATVSNAVTSAYGGYLFDTKGTPVSNVGVDLNLGAAASPTTPAGDYSATLSLIAVGTF